MRARKRNKEGETEHKERERETERGGKRARKRKPRRGSGERRVAIAPVSLTELDRGTWYLITSMKTKATVTPPVPPAISGCSPAEPKSSGPSSGTTSADPAAQPFG